MNRKNKGMTNAEYQELKTLLSYGLSMTKIGEITGRSWNTLSLVKKTENLEEYKAEAHKITLQNNQNRKKTTTSVPVEALNSVPNSIEIRFTDIEGDVNKIANNLDQITDILSNLLTRVYKLEQKSEKRGMFR